MGKESKVINQKIKFDNLDNILFSIIEKLIKDNDNIFKLLKYNSSNALEENITKLDKMILADVSNTQSLKNTRLFPYAYCNDIITTENMSQLRIYYEGFYPQNVYLSDITLGIDIIVHNNLRLLDNKKLRFNVILNELLKTLNGKTIIVDLNRNKKMAIILNFSKFCYAKLIAFNENFSGYRLTMQFQTN